MYCKINIMTRGCVFVHIRTYVRILGNQPFAINMRIIMHNNT